MYVDHANRAIMKFMQMFGYSEMIAPCDNEPSILHLDIAGQVPSEARQMQNLSPAQVLQEPHQRRQDTWSLEQEGSKRTLIRHHNLPRLALFNPEKAANCPVDLEELTGKRTTIVACLRGDGKQLTINDTIDIQRNLLDQTRFELKEIGPMPKRQKAEAPLGRRTAQMLKKNLRFQHHNLLSFKKHFNNVAQILWMEYLKGTSGTNECPVPECVLPGGHGGHHRDDKDEPFMYDPYEGHPGATLQALPKNYFLTILAVDHLTTNLQMMENLKIPSSLWNSTSTSRISSFLQGATRSDDMAFKETGREGWRSDMVSLDLGPEEGVRPGNGKGDFQRCHPQSTSQPQP